MRRALTALLVAAAMGGAAFGGTNPAVGGRDAIPDIEPFDLQRGDVVVADEVAGDVVRLRAGRSAVIATGMGAPRGVALAVDGTVLVVDRDAGRVLRLLPSGTANFVAEGLDRPDDVVALDGPGALVVETGAGRVVRVQEGAPTEVVASGLPRPNGIDRPIAGVVAVVSVTGGTEGDGFLATLPLTGEGPLPHSASYGLPRHIDTAPDGPLFLADGTGFVVEVVDTGPAGTPIDAGGPLVGATGVAVDESVPGDDRPYSLLVTLDRALVRLDPDSGATTVLATFEGPAGVDVVAGRADVPTTTSTTAASTTTTIGSDGAGPTAATEQTAADDRSGGGGLGSQFWLLVVGCAAGLASLIWWIRLLRGSPGA